MTEYNYTQDNSIVALATPIGKGAIAIIRCSGEDCWERFKPLFSQPSKISEENSHQVIYGWISNPQTKERVDEVLVYPFAKGKSFTGEQSLEISCHGGDAVIQEIIQLLEKQGLEQAKPGEFTYRAFMNGKINLTQAEAIQSLTSAIAQNERKLASAQLAHSITTPLTKIREQLLHTLAFIEVQLDYPEDEVSLPPLEHKAIKEITQQLEEVMASYHIVSKIHHGLNVVLVGATNAGKSSLFNLIVKQERAIVSEKAGTTRDYIETQIELEGFTINLFDTAGIRDNTENEIEEEGIKRSKQLVKSADIILYVHDSSLPLSLEDQEFIDQLESNWIGVWNKADLPNSLPVPHNNFVQVTTKENSGIGELAEQIKERLPKIPQEPIFTATTQRQINLIQEALNQLTEVLNLLDLGLEYDLISEHLRMGINALGMILGEEINPDILEEIFSQFCVGK